MASISRVPPEACPQGIDIAARLAAGQGETGLGHPDGLLAALDRRLPAPGALSGTAVEAVEDAVTIAIQRAAAGIYRRTARGVPGQMVHTQPVMNAVAVVVARAAALIDLDAEQRAGAAVDRRRGRRRCRHPATALPAPVASRAR